MNTFHITNRLLKSTLFCGLLLFSSSALSCSSDDDGGGNGGTQLEWLEPIRVASYNIQYDNRNEEAGRWENRKEIVCRLLEAEDSTSSVRRNPTSSRSRIWPPPFPDTPGSARA